MIRSCRFLLIATPLFMVAVGCGGKSGPPVASLKGNVTYNGAPVTGGSLMFHGGSGKPNFSTAITAQGTYSIADVAPGEYTVVVSTEGLNPKNKSRGYPGGAKTQQTSPDFSKGDSQQAGAPTQPEGTYVKIPSKYSSAKTSTKKVTVGEGEIEQNIDLTD